MANHKSAAKRARQSIRKNARNSAVEGSVRTFEKRLRTAIAAGDQATAQEVLKDYMSKVSKAATKGVVHKKTAARKMSRISLRVNEMGKAPTVAAKAPKAAKVAKAPAAPKAAPKAKEAKAAPKAAKAATK